MSYRLGDLARAGRAVAAQRQVLHRHQRVIRFFREPQHGFKYDRRSLINPTVQVLYYITSPDGWQEWLVRR